VTAVVSRRNPRRENKAHKARPALKRHKAHGAKHMGRKRINEHAKKVRAYMKIHPRATLAKASKAVAKKKRKGRKNPSRSSRIAASMRRQGATPEMIEAALAHRKARLEKKWAGGSKGRKRRRAAKKAAATRARNKAKAKAKSKSKSKTAHSKAYKKRYQSLLLKGRRLTNRIQRLSSAAKQATGKKRSALRAKVSAARARKSALSVKRRALDRRWPGGKYARTHGLTRVNPSLSGVAKDLMALLPEIGAGVGSMVGMAVIGPMVMNKLPDSVKSKVPESVKPWVPAITTGVLAAVAYGALRMSKSGKLSKMSVPVLIGGAAATALHAMVAIQMKDASGQQISLAKKLGLPMGEFVGVSGYVDVNGQMVAVNGLGEFVGVSGTMLDASGQQIAVNGLGEYLNQEVGLGAAGDGIFSKSSLGALPDGSAAQEADMGREWSRGLSEEVGAESILEEGEGTLSGSIFDD